MFDFFSKFFSCLVAVRGQTKYFFLPRIISNVMLFSRVLHVNFRFSSARGDLRLSLKLSNCFKEDTCTVRLVPS